jgi:hypothetical protein
MFFTENPTQEKVHVAPQRRMITVTPVHMILTAS